jgi:hypothetical protein
MKYSKTVWIIIKDSIDILNKSELEKRFWKLYEEMSTVLICKQSAYMDIEFRYIANRLKNKL